MAEVGRSGAHRVYVGGGRACHGISSFGKIASIRLTIQLPGLGGSFILSDFDTSSESEESVSLLPLWVVGDAF